LAEIGHAIVTSNHVLLNSFYSLKTGYSRRFFRLSSLI